jgi:hypothetical protein
MFLAVETKFSFVFLISTFEYVISCGDSVFIFMCHHVCLADYLLCTT